MTFQDIFIIQSKGKSIRVPDYQRAYSWEEKQIDLFINDLRQYQGEGGYYFGHFIVEEHTDKWDLVDGQQRLTTVVLFLLVCRLRFTEQVELKLMGLLDQFQTVGYDQPVLDALQNKATLWPALGRIKSISDDAITSCLQLDSQKFTASARRMVQCALRFYRAFENGEIHTQTIAGYVAVLANASSSIHLTHDKAVAVSVFEMHNTRGVPLKLIEVVKAKLMRCVYQNAGEKRDERVREIQDEFAAIHAMEERLETSVFRGRMTIEAMVRHHLRVIDDGHKKDRDNFSKPDKNASPEQLLSYVDERLIAEHVNYPLNLARELRRSMHILCHDLPAWDTSDALVGDVMILKRNVSTEFFLVACRRFASNPGKTTDGRVSPKTMRLWEGLLFTYDFHEKHYRLKGDRDNFPEIYAKMSNDEAALAKSLRQCLAQGFRADRTNNLQSIVRSYLGTNKTWILTHAFGWWKEKITYTLYKFEVSLGANLRQTMHGAPSVEHILPQEWQWCWAKKQDPELADLTDAEANQQGEQSQKMRDFAKAVSGFIHGLGNLLLITSGENSSLSNEHPATKQYGTQGGSYKRHAAEREKWLDSTRWESLILDRGEAIHDFMLDKILLSTGELEDDVSMVGCRISPGVQTGPSHSPATAPLT